MRSIQLFNSTLPAVLAAALAIGPAWAKDLIAFHVPDPASSASLRDHAGRIAVVAPAWMTMSGPDHLVTIAPDPLGHDTLAALPRRPKLWPMIQNNVHGQWDGAGAAALFHDPAATEALLDTMEAELDREHASGVVIDFEELPADAQADFVAFLTRAHVRTRARRWTLAVAAPVADPAWNLAAVGAAVDRVILMAYDQHWQTSGPGPIAADDWFRSVVAKAAAQLPPGRAVVGVASYVYDWPTSGPATVLSVEQARALAAQAGVAPAADPASGAEHFSYVAADGTTHQVWLGDAATVGREIAVARQVKAAGVALWRLGLEDPAIWSVGRDR